ncbi:DUF3977 family protein [Paenibacillus sp. NPDC057967]|uniref:DUF3977 family protein n=1 Tax=Paenibacillus sp. NPDC057967 TaxID=3346293 RepID=UPI0036DACAF9
MKYIEAGIGNRWFIRTETELDDGTEIEQRGIVKPILFHSAYLRIWIGKTVYIWDTKERFKKTKKPRRAFKFILGVASYSYEVELKTRRTEFRSRS